MVAATAVLSLAVLFGAGLAGCAKASSPASVAASGTVLGVVAAENDWGSIAAQIGGRYVDVRSVIRNPNADPHAYEPTPADARSVAAASLVWYNGIGYDPWMPKLLAADPVAGVRLDVGQVLGVAAGGNPHRWYNPTDVAKVIAAYVADLSRLEPDETSYFRASARAFETVGLHSYHAEIALIRTRYAGTPVGASESIFSMLAPALGLRVITPGSFLRAVSEGTDVSAGAKATIDRQIKRHLIRAYVFNSQNTTPDVQVQLAECAAAGIPTVGITETLVPPGASFQRWQTRQLDGIAAALARGTGR